MKRTLVLAALILLSVSVAAAQGLTVSYVEGAVTVRNGSTWQDLAIGDTVHSTATLHLGEASYIEMRDGSSRISLSQKGVYSLDDLLAVSRQIDSAGVGQVLASRLAALFGASTSQSIATGVRSAKAEDNSGISWQTSDTQVYVDAAKEYIKSGSYPKAIEELKRAADNATDTELPEIRYYLGYAYSLAGDTRHALKQVVDLQPADLETAAANLVLLKGKLLLDTNAFAEDVKWLTANTSLVSTDSERGQVYYLLLGLSYAGIGDKTSARVNLQRVVSVAGSSDLGKTAAELLDAL